MDAHEQTSLEGVDWTAATRALVERGWVRLERVVDAGVRVRLAAAAPPTWTPLPEVEGVVRQGGERSGTFFEQAAAVVQAFGCEIGAALNQARPDLPTVPRFNEVQWGRSRDGGGFITAHRDPPAAGGVIATTTLRGRARFRIWHDNEVTQWETEAGDLVILRGYGWPTEDSLCPLHEVESLRRGDRMTMTLRHNTGGPGSDYFA